MEEITYTLHVTLIANNHKHQLGKELSSPKKIMAALKKTAYPPNFDNYKDIHFMKHTKVVTSERTNIKYNTI